MSYAPYVQANFGSGSAGLATVGVTVYDSTNTEELTRSTLFVEDLGGGIYGSFVIVSDSSFTGRVQFDTGGANPAYDNQTLNPSPATTTIYTGANFGSGKASLATVGYRLYDSAGGASGSRITVGVQEWGGGWYGATVTLSVGFEGSIVWDTGEATPAYVVTRADGAPTAYTIARFGAAKAGLATVGFAVYTSAGVLSQSRSTVGVAHLGGGTFGASVTVATAFQGYVRWDTGEASPIYSVTSVNPVVSTVTFFLSAYFGPTATGLTGVGYRLYNALGTPVGTRVTSGIIEIAGGWYGCLITFSARFQGTVRWDSGQTNVVYAACPVNLAAQAIGVGSTSLISHWGARPVAFQDFGGGLVLDTDASEIRANQSPDCRNVDLEEAAVTKRHGQAAYNSVVPTAPMDYPVDGLGSYYATDDTRSVVIATNGSIYVDPNNSGDFLQTGSPIMTGFTAGEPVDLVQFQNKLYVGTQSDGLQAWTGAFAPATGDVYTPDISGTPPAAPLLAIKTLKVDGFETATWTTRNAANTAGGTMTATLVTTLFKEGAGSLRLSLPNTAMNEFVYRDFATAIDLSQAEALGIWVYQSTGSGAAFQVAVHDGTGNTFTWTTFPAFRVEHNQTWEFFRIPLTGLQTSDRDAVKGLAIRFLGYGQDDTGVAMTTLDYLYFDCCYALGPFVADRYHYWFTSVDFASGVTYGESAPSSEAVIQVTDDVPCYAITVDNSTYSVGGAFTRIYRQRDAGSIATPKYITQEFGWIAAYDDLTSDATLILENREDLIFGRAAPPAAATYAAVRHRMFAGNVASYPWRVHISEFAYPERFGNVLNPTFLINGPGYLDLPERDAIRRILDVDGMAVIFTDRSIWTVEGTGFDNFELRKRASVGLVSRSAVAYHGSLLYFYSGDGLRVLQPSRDNPGTFATWLISEPVYKSRIKTIPSVYRDKAAMGVDEAGRIHFSFTPSGETVNSRALVFDPRMPGALSPGHNPNRPGWTEYDNWGFSHFTTLRSGEDDHGAMLGGDPETGKVWRLQIDENGEVIEDDAGVSIPWWWTSRVADMGAGSTAQPAWINGSFDPQPNAIVYLETVLDRGRKTLVVGGTLEDLLAGAQPLHGRLPGERPRQVQVKVLGEHSVAMRCHALTLGIYNPR